jgi:DNA-binding IclR family transcriptional regulator
MNARKKLKNTVPMVVRTFEVLEAFREKTDGVTYKELIARFPEVPPASIYRIICSLEATGYLWKDETTNKFELGAKFIEMGRLTERRQNILRFSQAHMERLRDKFGENVNLIKIEHAELVYIRTLEGHQSLRVTELRRRRHCVHSSAAGKAIMAQLPVEEREELVSELELVRLTPSTITTPKALLQELERVRRQGYAVDAEENLEGVSCVAAPILNGEGYPIAAISVSSPTFRLPPQKTIEVAESLMEVAQEISRSGFGFDGAAVASLA